MANNTVCRDRQTAFLPRLKPGASCLFLVIIMTEQHEVQIFGLARSLHLMVIFIVAFVGLCFVFTTTYADVEFPIVAKGLVGSALGLAAAGVIYGIVRYHIEQAIAYIAINTLQNR